MNRQFCLCIMCVLMLCLGRGEALAAAQSNPSTVTQTQPAQVQAPAMQVPAVPAPAAQVPAVPAPAMQAPAAQPAVQAASQARKPLLQPGKTTLFQRVVSHPGAALYAGPEAGAAVRQKTVKTFTVYYVYATQGNRSEVGVASTGADGWIDNTSLTVWPQAITMLFTERGNRMPVLFFKDHASLEATCTDNDLAGLVSKYRNAVQGLGAGQSLPASVPVVAMEPPDSAGAVSRNRFYLMPVLNMDNQFSATRLVEVASIDPGTGSNNQADAQASQKPAPQQELHTGMVFVIDTTISMRPYIEQTLALVRNIYDTLEKSPDGNKVAFAVVAYRNSTKASPGLEYTSKVVSDFATVKDRARLEKALAEVREATVSSHSVDEDSLAGVKTAVDKLSWQDYGSRVMLLVSDAGPLPGSDAYAITGMDSAEMADYLKSNSIWLTALHIRSPKGKKNHSAAEQAYRQLSRMTDGTSSYVGIDASTPAKGAEAFNSTGKALADGYRGLVEATAQGRLLKKPVTQSLAVTPQERARQLAEISGYAMQLEFLGAKRGNQAPSVVKAWIADADLERLAKNADVPVMAVEPAVLLTKNQLSDLTAQLKLLLAEATRSQRVGGTDFFQSLLSMAAQITRDPSRFSHTPGQNLAQSGLMGEFLQGLPYKSDVLSMTEQDWYNKSVGEQTQFINRLKSRIARYEEYDKDRSNWESFGSSNTGDWVYRVPLSTLP